MVLAQKFLLVKFYRIGAGFSNAVIIVIAKISEFLLFVNVIVTISEVFFLLKMLAVDEREVSISRELHHLTNFTNWNFSFNFSGLSPIIRFLSHCLLFLLFFFLSFLITSGFPFSESTFSGVTSPTSVSLSPSAYLQMFRLHLNRLSSLSLNYNQVLFHLIVLALVLYFKLIHSKMWEKVLA